LGIKGFGEIGIVGVPAAVANAVYRATGKRVRDMPITLDKFTALTEPREGDNFFSTWPDGQYYFVFRASRPVIFRMLCRLA
jgi:hypothetical protein